jgi:hypothetical protein
LHRRLLFPCFACVLITATVAAQQIVPTTSPAAADPAGQSQAQTAKATRAPITPAAPKAEERLRDPWLERANYITAQLQEDSGRMKNFRDALLMGRIGQAWWPVDQKKALFYLNKAASAVDIAGQNESSENAAARFDVLQVLLAATATLEPSTPAKKEVHDRLFKVLLSAAIHFAESPGDKSNRKQLNSIRNALSRIAAESASERRLDDAIPATSALIRLPGAFLMGPLGNIYRQDPRRGEELFMQGITQAQSSGEPNLVATLVDIAFPDGKPPTPPTAQMQDAAAQLYADVAMQALSRPERKQQICFLTSRASQVVPHLPPALAGQVSTAFSSCADMRDRTLAMANQVESLQLETVDDYLRAAADEPDLEKRAALKRQAYVKTFNAQDGVRALEILRSLTPEEKEKDKGLYDWWNPATMALSQMHKTHNFRGIDRVIDEAPDDIRGALLVKYAQLLGSEKDNARLLTVLRRARKELDEHKANMDRWYPLLLVEYNKVDQSQTLGVLRMVVTGLNRFSGDTMEEALKKKGSYNVRLVDSLEPMPGTGLALIDFDEGTVDAAIKELDSPDYRTVFRLSLLIASLRQEAAEHPPIAPSSEAKLPRHHSEVHSSPK